MVKEILYVTAVLLHLLTLVLWPHMSSFFCKHTLALGKNYIQYL